MTADFLWHAERDVIAVPPQMAVAVYCNEDGDVVIRQQAAWCDDEDAVVIIAPENVPKLLAAITREATLTAPLALPAPKQSFRNTPGTPKAKETPSPNLPFAVE